jgi:CubicO group peptidase (beta-lactamase class C family)
VPATEKTPFNVKVAWLTRPILAEVILLLVSRGKISLDETVATYWIDRDVKDKPWHELLNPSPVPLSSNLEFLARPQWIRLES